MTEFLTELPTPDWLQRLTSSSMVDEPFPLVNLLTNSLYYPCCGFDGRPVQFLGPYIHSFIYVDYGNTRTALLNELNVDESKFLGYEILGQREVQQNELVPDGWRPIVQPDFYRVPPAHSDPFCEWLVFQRSEHYDEQHGPERFSLLYLCADGAAAYQALFTKITPKGIAIIQPGTGFGGNYTDYTDPAGLFSRSVRATGNALPEILLNGGIGRRDFYNDPIWPENYHHDLGWLPNQFIRVWGRS